MYLRALELDPDNVEAHQQYAEYLAYLGRLDEASQAIRRAIALDRSPIRLNVAAYIAHHDNRIEAAIQYLDEGIRADPEGNVGFLRFNRAVAHMQTDRDPVARTLLLDALRRNFPDITERMARAWPASRGLPTPEAIEIIEDVRGWDFPAQAWMLIDRPERAIERIVKIRDRMPFGQTDHWWSPLLDPLRNDPRVIATQEAWGLAGYEPQRSGSGSSRTETAP